MDNLLQPLVRIGKNGLTPGIVEEIKKQLKKHPVVKIKLLHAFHEDKHVTAETLAEECNAELVRVVGKTIVLGRK